MITCSQSARAHIEFWTWWTLKEKLTSAGIHKSFFEIIEKHLKAKVGRPITDIGTYASFWLEAGYDYALLQVRGQPLADSAQIRIGEGLHKTHTYTTSSTNEAGPITDQRSFEEYPWIGPRDVYYRDVDLLKDHLPDGMKLIVNHGPIFQSLFRMMGMEVLELHPSKIPT